MRRPGKHEKKCPQCFEICNKDARSCGGCGHEFTSAERAGGKKPIDTQCQWQSGGQRCCFPGTSTRDSKTDDDGNAHWLCRFHADSRSHSYGVSILEMSKQWRDGTLADAVIYSEVGAPLPVYPREGASDADHQRKADEYFRERGLATRNDCVRHMQQLTGAKDRGALAAGMAKRLPHKELCLRNSREAIARHESGELVLPPWVLEHHKARVAASMPHREPGDDFEEDAVREVVA